MEKNVLNFNVPLISTRSALSLGSSDCYKGNAIMSEWNLNKKDIPSCISEYKSMDETESFAIQEHFSEKINGRNLHQLDIKRSRHPPEEDDTGISRRFVDKKNESVLAFNLSNEEYSGEESVSESDSFDQHSCFESYCRVSDFGESDSPIDSSSTDPKIRDFIMNRFLPAAKAMTVEFPSYCHKKQQIFVEPRSLYEKVFFEGGPPLIHGVSYQTPYHLYEEDMEDRESDDSDVDVGNMPSRSCGFIPRFHRIRSLCLLNPMLGFSPKTIHSKSGKHGGKADSQISNPVAFHHHIPTSNSKKLCEEKLKLEKKASESSSSSHSSSIACYMDMIKASRLTPPPFNPPPFSFPSHQIGKTDHNSSYSMADNEDDTAIARPRTMVMANYDRHICPPPLKFLPPLPPPLPKSPSDSWLSQTLSRKTKPHLNVSKSSTKRYPKGNRHQPATKWETIVKTSYMHSDHARFSEELTTTSHASSHQKIRF